MAAFQGVLDDLLAAKDAELSSQQEDLRMAAELGQMLLERASALEEQLEAERERADAAQAEKELLALHLSRARAHNEELGELSRQAQVILREREAAGAAAEEEAGTLAEFLQAELVPRGRWSGSTREDWAAFRSILSGERRAHRFAEAAREGDERRLADLQEQLRERGEQLRAKSAEADRLASDHAELHERMGALRTALDRRNVEALDEARRRMNDAQAAWDVRREGLEERLRRLQEEASGADAAAEAAGLRDRVAGLEAARDRLAARVEQLQAAAAKDARAASPEDGDGLADAQERARARHRLVRMLRERQQTLRSEEGDWARKAAELRAAADGAGAGLEDYVAALLQRHDEELRAQRGDFDTQLTLQRIEAMRAEERLEERLRKEQTERSQSVAEMLHARDHAELLETQLQHARELAETTQREYLEKQEARRKKLIERVRAKRRGGRRGSSSGSALADPRRGGGGDSSSGSGSGSDSGLGSDWDDANLSEGDVALANAAAADEEKHNKAPRRGRETGTFGVVLKSIGDKIGVVAAKEVRLLKQALERERRSRQQAESQVRAVRGELAEQADRLERMARARASPALPESGAAGAAPPS